jgi:murein L,D-transpeptidase YafK
MKKFVVYLFLFNLSMMKSQDFLNNQLTNTRVIEANTKKYEVVKSYFIDKNLSFPNSTIYWRAFKWNKALELWSYSQDSQKYILIHTYPICEIVGDLGPKRQEGDFQIPEGFYNLENFNPNSKYHLSLKISYPNESDRILGLKDKLGGDIYVHGKCETIGCLPMTDDLIEEIYLINMYAKAEGQEMIPFHIFPTKLTSKNYNKLKQEYYNGNLPILAFWLNLKEGFDYFDKKRILPSISIDESGKYLFK